MLVSAISFPARHWQGRVSLLPTCLLTLLGLRLALDALGALRPDGWPLASVLALSLGSAAVLLWQMVGGLRATLRAGHNLLSSSAGYLAVLITALLYVVSEADFWAARNAARLDLPPPPAPYAITGEGLLIEGPLSYDTLARLDATLAQAPPGLRRIDLQSNGGHVPAARALAKRIEDAGLDTRATGLCASACTLVFAAGRRRSLGPGGALGFHGYALRRNDPLQTTAEEEARDRAWLGARGFAAGFVARVHETRPPDLWLPSPEELFAAGAITERP